MPYNKLNISGSKADILAWVNHDLSIDEQNMIRNVSRLSCLFKHVALMPELCRYRFQDARPASARRV